MGELFDVNCVSIKLLKKIKRIEHLIHTRHQDKHWGYERAWASLPLQKMNVSFIKALCRLTAPPRKKSHKDSHEGPSHIWIIKMEL